MAALDYFISGGVTNTSAIVASKLQYTPVYSEPELRVLRVDYNGTTVKSTVNGKAVSNLNKTGNWSFIDNLMIGSDGDEVGFFRGHIPEIIIYKNQLSDTDSVAVERWLADKWLSTQSTFENYTIQSSEGTYPTISNQKFLHFDESTLIVSGGKVTQWNDKANFNGSNKSGIPTQTIYQPDLQTNRFKNKNVAYFNGNGNFKVGGLHTGTDPDFCTIFVVYRFDSFDLGSDQVLLGDIDSTPTYNKAIRFKKYSTDDFISIKIGTSSGTNASSTIQIPRTDANGTGLVSDVLIGSQRLLYSKNSDFSNGVYTGAVATRTSTNGVAKFNLTGLEANTKYYYKIEIDSVLNNDDIGTFKTFLIEQPVSFNFIAGSCNYSGSNAETWSEIAAEDLLFWAHMGDWHYDDIPGNNQQLFRNGFGNTARQPNMKNLLKKYPLSYVYDDHDYGANNSDATSASRPAVISFYKESIPSYPLDNPDVNGVYHAFTIGRVRFIHTDMRSNRTPFLSLPKDDPNKTMLGANQKAWFKQQLLDAKNNPNISLIVWLNPSPWTGDDTNPYSWDYGAAGEHWTTYLVERKEIHQFIIDNSIKNILIINGDTHQQAIDDGRNSVYATDVNGVVLDWKSLNTNLLTPVVEASPFHKDVDNGSGPFDINDIGDSGKVIPMSEKAYTLFKVTDLGYNWIKVDIEQYCLPDGITYYSSKTLVKKYSFVRDCNGISFPKPSLDNALVKSIKGNLKITNPNEPLKLRRFEWISPTSFKSNWKAPIQGKIINTSLANHKVKVFRRSDIDYEISAIGGLSVDNTTGIFNFPGNFGVSQLVFKLYDNSGTLIDETTTLSNTDVYQDLKLQLYYITDIPYLIREQAVPVNSTYEFPNVDVNAKSNVRLTRISTNEIKSKTRIYGELPRSYIVQPGDSGYGTPFASKSYLYDAALSLISLSRNEIQKQVAVRIADGIVNSQISSTGAFPFSVNHISPPGADPYVRNGGTAWVTYALAYFLQQNPLVENRSKYETCLTNVLNYLISKRNFTTQHGLITGGSGRYVTNGGVETFDPTYQIPWVSTEHNLDSFFAFKLAGVVLNNATFTNISQELSTAIQNYLSDGTTRMYQGLSADGTHDSSDALDINSWGAMFWSSIGRNDMANVLLARAENYYACVDVENSARGYKPYSSLLGYPSAVDTVWFEGSFGVAMAYYKVGNISKYNQIIANLNKYRESDGSFRYATLRDDVYEISDKKSLASTCWSIMTIELPQYVWV